MKRWYAHYNKQFLCKKPASQFTHSVKITRSLQSKISFFAHNLNNNEDIIELTCHVQNAIES